MTTSNDNDIGRRAVEDRNDPVIGGVAINYAAADQVLTVAARGLYISGAGNLVVETIGGDTLTFTGLLAGVIYPVAVRKIIKLGSSAAGLVLT